MKMGRFYLVLLFLSGFTNLHAQNGSKNRNENIFEISTYTSWIYGIKAETEGKYPPFTSGKSGMLTFEVSVGFRLRFLWIYPTYSWGFTYRNTLLNNPGGEYLPLGYGLSLPYSVSNPEYYYSENYEDLSVSATSYQKSVGSYFTLSPIKGFELGAGIFRRNVETHVFTKILYDGYYYYNSNGTQTDEYSYDQTYLDGYRESIFTKVHYSIPLIMQLKGNRGTTQGNTAVIWSPGKNGYWQFRAGLGFGF